MAERCGRRSARPSPSADLKLLSDSQVAFWYKAGRLAGLVRPRWRRPRPLPALPAEAPPGISLVIPSRNGRELLAAQFPGIVRELAPLAHEILVVDNGSTDGTEAWLHSAWPAVQVDVSPAPLSFAAAVNRGIRRARYSHICLLNNESTLWNPASLQRCGRRSSGSRGCSALRRKSASRPACGAKRPAKP